MKKLPVLLLTILLLLSACTAAFAASEWYCPSCGRKNDNNFCPHDGTPRPSDDSSTYYGSDTRYASVNAVLNRRLATRTGPGTKYDEPGSFLSAGCSVKALSKAYDSANGIWWVHVEFTAGGKKYRAYTGAKRFDNLNLDLLPEEGIIGTCSVQKSVDAYYGPSQSYAPIRQQIPVGVQCDIYGYVYGVGVDDSDFVQIEFYDYSQGCKRRAWVAEWWLNDFHLY